MYHNDNSIEYKYLLKKHASYDDNDSSDFEFKYQSLKAEELVQLRKQYELDQVIGDGDEINQIINLLTWVKNNIIHDGSQVYTGKRNALEIIETSKKGQGVNCRMVATAMCEIFLAMGFKARFQTGMPIGFDFKDCHVTNSVYSEQLSKWVFIDPSTGFYIMDTNDTLLSYEEFRNHLINEKEIKIIRTAVLDELVDAEYKRYMTKNSFMIMTNDRFEFNAESDNNNMTRVYLTPVGYIPSGRKEIQKENYVIEEIYTSNAKAYWDNKL